MCACAAFMLHGMQTWRRAMVCLIRFSLAQYVLGMAVAARRANSNGYGVTASVHAWTDAFGTHCLVDLRDTAAAHSAAAVSVCCMPFECRPGKCCGCLAFRGSHIVHTEALICISLRAQPCSAFLYGVVSCVMLLKSSFSDGWRLKL